MASERISLYNLADLKNTTDDAIANYLNSLKFRQVHTKTDVRLALGYAALAVAGACFVWDYKLGFEGTKWWTAAAVVLYGLLNGALTVWIWAVERGVVYEGIAPGGEKIEIASSTKKYVPKYTLTITTHPKDTTQRPQTTTFSRPFAEWFNAQGHLVTPPFQQMLASRVPVIGKLNPERVVVDPAVRDELAGVSPEVLDAILAASSSASAVGSSTATEAGAKKARSRKA